MQLRFAEAPALEPGRTGKAVALEELAALAVHSQALKKHGEADFVVKTTNTLCKS